VKLLDLAWLVAARLWLNVDVLVGSGLMALFEYGF
jgi:hypothetical protein